MKKVIDELKASSVLTKEEIERIKLYVNKKYPNNSSKENAVVLSNTIYGIIDSSLEGITAKEKQNIRKSIIQSTILNDKKDILKWDVFKALTTELRKNPQLKNPLIKWVNKNQNNTVSQDILEEYVISIGNKGDKKELSYLDIELPQKYEKLVSSKFTSLLKKANIQLKSALSKIFYRKIALSIFTLLILSLYSLNNFIINNNMLKDKLENKNTAEMNSVSSIDTSDLYVKDVMSYHPYLPDYFNYKNIDKVKLLEFLNTRDSILAEEPYFSAIIRSSKEFNLNPHILFAITGQEQSFVPKNHEDAEKIANNPFNVFHSWEEYNTDIYDSSRIAARTIINLAKDKPTNMDIFDWINSKYAGDVKWGRGVKEIFEKIERIERIEK